MKKATSSIAIALLLCVISVSAVSAKVKSRAVTFGQDFALGGTLVKAGTYTLSFDDQANTLTVSDRKTKEVIAKAEARAEARRAGSVLGMDIQIVGNGGSAALASVAFPGEKMAFAVSGATAAK
jgi:outer membrane receptor for Fe3+-dicitrate